MDHDEINSILTRLDRLERYHQRWKRGAMAAFAGVAVLLVGAVPLGKYATPFRFGVAVQDRNGEPRIAAYVDPEENETSTIELKDQRGNNRLSFVVDKTRSEIILSDENGKPKLTFAVVDGEMRINGVLPKEGVFPLSPVRALSSPPREP